MVDVNVMLLAAGRSTRLGALGLAAPKPLVPVCGYPAIRFGLHAAARAGARRAVVNVFHRGDLVQAVLGDRVVGRGPRPSTSPTRSRPSSSERAAAWPKRGRCSKLDRCS